MQRLLFSLLLIVCWMVRPEGPVFAQEGPEATPETAPATTQSPPGWPTPTGMAAGVSLTLQDGQALKGVVVITGRTPEDTEFIELSFTYANHPAPAWFLIAESDTPLRDGPLAEWDTTQISDGDYDLQLVATLADGSRQTATVRGLRVRNSSPVETATPTPTRRVTPTLPAPGALTMEAPTETPTPEPSSTPATQAATSTVTPQPTNPAQISPAAVSGSLQKGVLGTIGLFALMGAYGMTRSVRNKKRG